MKRANLKSSPAELEDKGGKFYFGSVVGRKKNGTLTVVKVFLLSRSDSDGTGSSASVSERVSARAGRNITGSDQQQQQPELKAVSVVVHFFDFGVSSSRDIRGTSEVKSVHSSPSFRSVVGLREQRKKEH